MRGELIAIACVLAGCHEQPGLLIEVHGTKAGARIDLYSRTTACGDACPTITPPPADADGPRTTVTGTGYTDDEASRNSAPIAGGSSANFLLEAAGADLILPRLIAIELDSNGEAIASATFGPVTVPHDSSAIADVPLLAADAYGSTTTDHH